MPIVPKTRGDHREKDVPEKDLETMRPEELIIETRDTLYAAAASDADSEGEPEESHGERLKREAKSLRLRSVPTWKNAQKVHPQHKSL